MRPHKYAPTQLCTHTNKRTVSGPSQTRTALSACTERHLCPDGNLDQPQAVQFPAAVVRLYAARCPASFPVHTIEKCTTEAKKEATVIRRPAAVVRLYAARCPASFPVHTIEKCTTEAKKEATGRTTSLLLFLCTP